MLESSQVSFRRRAQRANPRFVFSGRVMLFEAERTEVTAGRALGISLSGLAAVLPRDLSLGQTVELEFVFPLSSDALHLRAIVRNRIGDRYGFEFVSLSTDHRDALDRGCTALAPL